MYLWYSVAVQSDHNTSEILISMLDVEVHLLRNLWALGGFDSLAEVDESEGQDHQASGKNSL